MKWRPLLFKLHRDIGFLCFGLTVVYAVSGIAVNHRADWDYNYAVDFATHRLGSPAQILGLDGDRPPDETASALARERQEHLVDALISQLGRADRPRKVFWRGPDRLSLFFGERDWDIVDYLPSRGIVEHTAKSERYLLRDFNILHLNQLRRVWTWFADAYAVLLLFLGISGVVMVRGRHSLRGRGGILTAIGIAIPVAALIWLTP